MKTPDYPLIAAMLGVTRITNEEMRRAPHDHLVLGDLQSAAAERYGYSKQQLGVHVKNLRGKIKPAFDACATLAVAGVARKK